MSKYYNFYQRLNVRPLTLIVLVLSLITCLSFPSKTSAHAYSASYTQITIDKQKTEVVFSIDTLSVLELIPKIDKNKNFVLEKSEIKAKENEHQLEELITEGLTLDKDNKELTPTIEKMEIVKKENKEFFSVHMSFPPAFPGETIVFNDGFYFHDTGTNYVDLISASIMGQSSEAVLQGKERTWTILVNEAQQEQGQEQEAQPNTSKEQPQSEAPVEQSSSSSWASFLKLGALHILTGYDHLLFLFALLLRKQTFKQYAGIVTAFTIAHSITLSLATLGWVTLPSRFVEATIAFSICYVALENIFRKEIRHRWSITFLFGLIHGLGFATLLKEMAIPKSHLAVALLNFNLGIEAVQLTIVLLLLPLLALLFNQKHANKFVIYGSYAIVALGAIWMFQRLFS